MLSLKITLILLCGEFGATNISKKLNIRRENVRNYDKIEYGLMSKSVDKTFMR
jgi:hypothetical protein